MFSNYGRLVLLLLAFDVMCQTTTTPYRHMTKQSPRILGREGRRMISYNNRLQDLQETPISFCRIGDDTAACMEETSCGKERGIFMGYCGLADGVCCNVVKTCGMKSSSHVVRFMSPKFPANETESRACQLDLHVGKGICAVRLEIDVLELSRYKGGNCPVDSMFILGTKRIMTPICGNMSNWETSFEAKENTDLAFALNLQGNPRYRFSMLLTQLSCRDIVPIRSPINAGIKNSDAEVYKPTPVPTTTTPATEETTMSEDITTITPNTDDDNDDKDDSFVRPERIVGNATTTPKSTVSTPTGRTPLPTGTYRTTKKSSKPLVEIKSAQHEIGLQSAMDYYDPTPKSSIFRQIFEDKTDNKCLMYEDPVLKESKPLTEKYSINEEPQCWLYDKELGRYKVSENCILEDQENEEEAPTFRIIGGKLTNINEYPWQVAITYKKKFFCGGALISDRHVLTASHCVFGSFYSGIQGIKVSLGDHDLRITDETNNTVLGIRKIIWHMHYSLATTKNDIAILVLERPVDFSYSISPVLLPTDLTNTYEKQNVTVTGWGRNSFKSRKTSPILKEYTSPVDNMDTCVKRWKPYPKISAIENMHICLNVTYGTPCHGDSGGPLVSCNNGNRCTLIGVVSFGFPLCRNVGLPAVFTRVTTYKRWIDINTTPLNFVPTR